MSRNIQRYVKESPDKMDAVTTSVHLERKQLEFVQRLNLNLSKFVRDKIESLMTEDKIELSELVLIQLVQRSQAIVEQFHEGNRQALDKSIAELELALAQVGVDCPDLQLESESKGESNE
jgi:hypothetical protein